MLPAPAFYDASKVASLWIERAALVAAEAEEHRRRHAIRPASEDRVKVALFGIDPQIAFCTPGSSLFVPGAVEDMQRTLAFLYRNLDRITHVCVSLDTHHVFQIFHPSWWVDARGEHPAPFTPITAKDVREGRFKPTQHEAECLEYVERLEASGKYVLTIWPYHALLGGVSHALVPALMEATIFHSLVRSSRARFETKGTHELTENYSVLSPEVQELGGARVGSFNTSLFDALMSFDRVYVFGQAKSHCVLSTLRDLRDRIVATDPSLLRRVHVLADTMSPVPPPPVDPLPPELDFPRLADAGLEELRAAGMKIVKSTDPLDVGDG